MRFDSSLQGIVQLIPTILSYFINHFVYFLLLAMIVYVAWNWSKLRAYWSILYAKNEKLMQPTFDKVENLLNKNKEEQNGTKS